MNITIKSQEKFVKVLAIALLSLLGLLPIVVASWVIVQANASDSYEKTLDTVFQNYANDLQFCSRVNTLIESEIMRYREIVAELSKGGAQRISLGRRIVTAYDPTTCKPYKGDTTSTGLPVGEGIFAVNPEKIPYGSLLHVYGSGISRYGIAADKGDALVRGDAFVDIFMPEYENAKLFGRALLNVDLIQFKKL